MNNGRHQLLLVEEDPTLREVTAFRLELLGYEVKLLSTAEEAIASLLEQLPDVIIVGYSLPGMGGVDLIDRISNDVRTSEVPVMLLSPNADLAYVQRAFNAGADEYLVTPYDPIVLEDKIERLAHAASDGAELTD